MPIWSVARHRPERAPQGHAGGRFRLKYLSTKELEDYEQTKSSLHFDPAASLPVALVRKLIKARIAET